MNKILMKSILFYCKKNLQSKKEQPILLKISYICERFSPQLVPLSTTLECYENF